MNIMFHKSHHRFGQAKLGYTWLDGLVLGLSQFSILARKKTLASKVVKRDSKIIILLY